MAEAPHPHFHRGIYAIIRNPEGAILVIRKSRGPYTGLYDLPGGSPEEGETPEQTLIREVTEETGCTVTHHTPLGTHTLEYPYTKNNEPWLLTHTGVLFSCTVTGTPSTTGDDQDSHGSLYLIPNPENLALCAPMVHLALTLTPDT